MEALMHGAGGMDLIDPLFQHVLAQAAKARKVQIRDPKPQTPNPKPETLNRSCGKYGLGFKGD